MKLIIGLGNPGTSYAKTRHNMGFMVVNELARKLGVSFKKNPKLQAEIAKATNPNNQEKYLLVKPQTFMNLSGQSVRAVLDFFQLEINDLVLVYDDLDLEIGNYKFQVGSSPKSHNGVNSVIQHLKGVGGEGASGGADFLNVRIGIDGRGSDRSIPSEKYVVQPFSAEEEKEIKKIIAEVTKELLQNLST